MTTGIFHLVIGSSGDLVIERLNNDQDEQMTK
jgi:hypothetical protein